MKFMMMTVGVLILLQSLMYGIRTLLHLSRRPRHCYPILHGNGLNGKFSLVAKAATSNRTRGFETLNLYFQ